METEIILSPEQEQKILDLWNANPTLPPSLKELTVSLFGSEKDGRTSEAKAIKKCLATRNLKAKTTEFIGTKLQEIELSEAHKKYIETNVITMTALDMARILFSNDKLTNLHA